MDMKITSDSIRLVIGVLSFSFLAAVPRVTGNTTNLYKDMAHIYIGAMIGAAIVSKLNKNEYAWVFFFCAFVLVILELVCFIKSGHKAILF